MRYLFICNKRNRTPSEHIGHDLYLYFLGLSLRNVARALSSLLIVKRSHIAVWQWIRKYKLKRKMASRKRRISEYGVDEAIIKTGSGLVWLWVAIEPKYMRVPELSTSKERKMLAAERFISGLVGVHLTMNMNKMRMDKAWLDYELDTVIDTNNIIPSGTRQNSKSPST
jgi:transposase-like protein